MKVTCPACNKLLLVRAKNKINTKKVNFSCPNCETILAFKPRKARCGACGGPLSYFQLHLGSGKNFVLCSSCGVTNRLRVKPKTATDAS